MAICGREDYSAVLFLDRTCTVFPRRKRRHAVFSAESLKFSRMNDMALYFAYGSNMDSKQMLVRCPLSRKLGQASLPGWRWIIASDGYANVVPAATDVVQGVLFELADADEATLDLFEEVALGTYAKLYLPVLHHEANIHAMVYVGPLVDEGVAAPEYVLRLQAALADAGLCSEYLARAVHRFIDVSHHGI